MRFAALAAAGAAIAGLTACSHPSPSAATGQPPAHASPATASPVAQANCGQQYSAWKHDHGKRIVAALNAVSSARTARRTRKLRAALRRARPAVARAARYPMPACADPMGYWNVLLMHVNAAVASRGSAASVRAAMKDVPKIRRELNAELRSTLPGELTGWDGGIGPPAGGWMLRRPQALE